jgi:hypothetical protein
MTGRQFAPPLINLIGRPVERANNQPVRARKRGRASYVDDDRGSGGAEPRTEFVRRNVVL